MHTPIITASDAEGAGEMFRLQLCHLINPPRNEDGSINFKEDFFGRATNLTVSGQLEGNWVQRLSVIFILLGPLSGRKIQIQPGILLSSG